MGYAERERVLVASSGHALAADSYYKRGTLREYGFHLGCVKAFARANKNVAIV